MSASAKTSSISSTERGLVAVVGGDRRDAHFARAEFVVGDTKPASGESEAGLEVDLVGPLVFEELLDVGTGAADDGGFPLVWCARGIGREQPWAIVLDPTDK